MNSNDPVILKRDVEAAIIPVGSKVTLQQGEQAYITQSLGGSYTVIVNGNMFRIEGKDADALGLQAETKRTSTGSTVSQEELEKEVWNQLRSCYDPEIPVNIVDLGLIYDCHLSPLKGGSGSAAGLAPEPVQGTGAVASGGGAQGTFPDQPSPNSGANNLLQPGSGAASARGSDGAETSYRIDVKMTLTAPGCGMGPMLAQDVQNRLLGLEGVDDVSVELVWDPPWNQAMMTEAAKLQLGLL